MSSRRALLLWSIPMIIGILLLHALIDTLFFNDNTFWDNFLRPGAHERFQHLLLIAPIGALAFAGSIALDRERKARRREAASERRYKTLFDVSPACIVVHDREGIIFTNRATLELFGISDFRPYQGQSVLVFVHPDDRDTITQRMAAIYATGESSPLLDARILMLDGSSREVNITSASLHLDDRQVLVTFLLDVTEVRSANRDLMVSQERLQLALDAAQDGVWDWDIRAGTVVYNEAWARMLGYRLEEIEPGFATWEALLHPSDRDRARRALNDHLEGRTTAYQAEVRLRHGKGHYLWVLDRGRIVARDEEGNPTRMAGTHRNIQRRKETELALEIRNRIARIFLTEMPGEVYPAIANLLCEVTGSGAGMIGLVERAGQFRIRAACRTHDGRLHAQEPPKTIFQTDSLPAFFQEVMDRREPVIQNRPIVPFEGFKELIDAMAIPILSGDEIVGLIMVANRDGGYVISDAVLVESLAEYLAPILQSHLSDQAKETQLRQAQKMEALGALAGGIAHDFNNILQAIIGFTTLAREQADQSGPLAGDLSRVLKAADRGSDLVKSILLFSRREEHERRSIKVEPLVREAVDLLKPTIPSTIEIQANLSSGTAEILADPSQISQIVLNLATNAFHAMEEMGGILRIDLGLIPRHSLDPEVPPKLRGVDLVSLTVSDTGCGMSPQVMDRLFDPFFTTKEVGKGTGLGLSVVHGIVVAHQGEIRISSEPGCGTVVNIYLPQAATGGSDVAMAPDRGVSIERARILFVDDEQDICDFGEAVLSRLGHEVLTFQDGMQALSRLREAPDEVDLVITDLTMPHLTGLQLASEITSLRPDLPVILITGVNDKPDWKLGPHQIVSAVLHKPFNQAALCDTVERLLRAAGAANEPE